METYGKDYSTLVESKSYLDFLDYVGDHSITQLIVYPNVPTPLELQRIPLQRTATAATAAVAVASSNQTEASLLQQWRNTGFDMFFLCI